MKAPMKAKTTATARAEADDAPASERRPAEPPMPRPPVRRATAPAGVPDLTPKQLEELRHELERRRSQLSESIEARRQEERSMGTGREVGDEMDDATTEGTASMTSKLLERDVLMLSEINHALSKFADGSYGVCEGTDEPIGYDRLRLRPWARYSVAYQEQLERSARTRGGV
jgi:DnaK suppressor protein